MRNTMMNMTRKCSLYLEGISALHHVRVRRHLHPKDKGRHHPLVEEDRLMVVEEDHRLLIAVALSNRPF
jgi:hypothetical protein